MEFTDNSIYSFIKKNNYLNNIELKTKDVGNINNFVEIKRPNSNSYSDSDIKATFRINNFFKKEKNLKNLFDLEETEPFGCYYNKKNTNQINKNKNLDPQKTEKKHRESSLENLRNELQRIKKTRKAVKNFSPTKILQKEENEYTTNNADSKKNSLQKGRKNIVPSRLNQMDFIDKYNNNKTKEKPIGKCKNEQNSLNKFENIIMKFNENDKKMREESIKSSDENEIISKIKMKMKEEKLENQSQKRINSKIRYLKELENETNDSFFLDDSDEKDESYIQHCNTDIALKTKKHFQRFSFNKIQKLSKFTKKDSIEKKQYCENNEENNFFVFSEKTVQKFNKRCSFANIAERRKLNFDEEKDSIKSSFSPSKKYSTIFTEKQKNIFKEKRASFASIIDKQKFDMQNENNTKEKRNHNNHFLNRRLTTPDFKINPLFEKKNIKRNPKEHILMTFKNLLGKIKNLKLDINEKVFSTVPFEKMHSKEFIFAAKIGDLYKIKDLLEINKYLVYDFDYTYMTALHWACKRGFFEIVEFLLENNADIESKDYFKRTPLYFTIQSNNLNVMKLLLRKKASPWSSKGINLKEVCKENVKANLILSNARKVF